MVGKSLIFSSPLNYARGLLKNGHHEKQKDVYKPKYEDWTYAIRGLTIDGVDIRIVIAFDDEEMLIITAIVMARGA